MASQSLGPIMYSDQGQSYQTVKVPTGMYSTTPLQQKLSQPQQPVYQQPVVYQQQPMIYDNGSRKSSLMGSCCIITAVVFIVSGIIILRRDLSKWCKNNCNSTCETSSCEEDCCIPIELKWVGVLFLIGGVVLLILGIWGISCKS